MSDLRDIATFAERLLRRPRYIALPTEVVGRREISDVEHHQAAHKCDQADKKADIPTAGASVDPDRSYKNESDRNAHEKHVGKVTR